MNPIRWLKRDINILTEKDSNKHPEQNSHKHSLPRKDLLQRVRLSKPSHLLAFGFGSGLARFMPGTFGSLAAIPFVYALSFLPLWGYLLLTLLATLVGIWICDVAAEDLKVHDHPSIVWDEFAGMFITFIAIPLNPLSLILGFALFRFFDIVKPWPIRWADKQVEGGLGIMLDDVIAGVFAAVALHAVLFFI